MISSAGKPDSKDGRMPVQDSSELETPFQRPAQVTKPHDPSTPAGKIFFEATRLFAKHGFKGASTRAIAKAAGVKQVMIHYYFGSKEQLYEAVLKHEGTTMLAVIFGENPEKKSPEEMLVDSPLRLMTVLHDNPQWASLLRREIAEGAAHLRNALRDVAEHGPLGANLHFHNAYQLAVKEGKAVELPIEAVRECLLAIGYSAIYLAPLVSMINERDIHDETVWDEWKLTLGTILRRGLLISPSPSQEEGDKLDSRIDGAIGIETPSVDGRLNK